MKLRDVWSEFREPLAEALGRLRNGAQNAAVRLTLFWSWWRAVHPKRVEAVGYLVLLTAALWEASLQHANNVVSELTLNQLDVQLKLILGALEAENAKEFLQANRPQFIDATSIISNLEDIKRWNFVAFYSGVRFALFMFGSLLVVTAKWKEGRRS